MFKKRGKYWSGLFNESMSGEYYNLPRQKFSKTYKPNGHIDIVRPDYFMKNNSFHGDKILCYFETQPAAGGIFLGHCLQ